MSCCNILQALQKKQHTGFHRKYCRCTAGSSLINFRKGVLYVNEMEEV